MVPMMTSEEARDRRMMLVDSPDDYDRFPGGSQYKFVIPRVYIARYPGLADRWMSLLFKRVGNCSSAECIISNLNASDAVSLEIVFDSSAWTGRPSKPPYKYPRVRWFTNGSIVEWGFNGRVYRGYIIARLYHWIPTWRWFNFETYSYQQFYNIHLMWLNVLVSKPR